MAKANARALNQAEAEHVRNRIRDLLAEGQTEQTIADMIGVSQQSVGRIKNDKQTPGYQLARNLAEAERVPVDALLDGVPKPLYKALASRAWPDHVMVAVVKMWVTVPRSRDLSTEDWKGVLRRTEEALLLVVKNTSPSRGGIGA